MKQITVYLTKLFKYIQIRVFQLLLEEIIVLLLAQFLLLLVVLDL